MVKFINYGKMKLENHIRSIFDINIARQIATDGNYYCIHIDHKTHERYAISREASMNAYSLGHILEEGQEAVFNGEKVRAMTYHELELYNEDRLLANVDIWGNIAVDDDFDMEWYLENCI